MFVLMEYIVSNAKLIERLATYVTLLIIVEVVDPVELLQYKLKRLRLSVISM